MPPDLSRPTLRSIVVQGGRPLHGTVVASGSKNAALPCLCAALLVREPVTLRNVPDIADVHTLLEIFRYLGVETSYDLGTVQIDATHLVSRPLSVELVSCLRASILLLGPLLARFGEVRMGYPGGDVIGKRPVQVHVDAFVQLGARDVSGEDEIHLVGDLHSAEIILPEFSVTATENVLLAAALLPEGVAIRLAACEPHVQNLCVCLRSLGVQVEGTGTHHLVVRGGQLHGGDHTVITDYLEVGFFVLAALVTDGLVRIERVRRDDLLSFLKVIDVAAPDALRFLDATTLQVCRRGPLRACQVRSNIFPGFPTDLLTTLGVALTQAEGVSRLFERLYEGRFSYLYELEKMGAKIEMLNAHEALVIGPTALRGRTVSSHDIRAGAAMVLAALCARGESVITDVHYLHRGYEKFCGKLAELGASIESVTTPR